MTFDKVLSEQRQTLTLWTTPMGVDNTMDVDNKYQNSLVQHMCLAKIQISLRIRAVWSESSLGAV